MEQSVKVSVIVPCYNSGKYTKNSLKCLLNQYYNNIEIICVNDGSTDNTAEVLEELAAANENIKVITLEENRGLFNARIVGADNASGDYIAFMDSDDQITKNWISSLVFKAKSSGADLVFGDMRKLGSVPNNTIDSHRACYYNLDPLRSVTLDTDGRGVLDLFMKMHGLCSHYHYVWNKLIQRDLWEACLTDLNMLNSVKTHLVMGEDIAFSATLFMFAKKVVNVHNAYYIYCIHNEQSVNTDSAEKYRKNIDDLVAVFDYLESLLEKHGYFEKYATEYKLLKQRYGMIYIRLGRGLVLPEAYRKYVSDTFLQEEIENIKDVKSELFLNQMTNTAGIDDVYYSLLDKIYSPDIKVISFDVFDTLVFRPFAKPLDMFICLNKPFTEIFGINSYVDFASIRHYAEEHCHKIQKALKPGIEEPTFDEIYDLISEVYGYDREKLREVQKIEIENEIKFSYPRKSACELFEIARNTGKKILLVSDMYLPRSCIEAILQKCGIEGYDKLYLSNEYHLTKHSGRLYGAISRELKDFALPPQFYHIGDNYDSDVAKAKGAGWHAQHYPAPMGLLQGRNPGIFTGLSYNKIFYISDRYTDMDLAYYSYTGLRSCLAVVANKIFDFPYVSFNKNSDLNADPKFVGYFITGMHVFAIARWLIKKTRGKGIRKIHFAARDGYLIKKAYDILSEGLTGLPQSSYIRVSRKSFAIADIKSFNDVHSIVQKLNYASQTPESIYELFKPVMTTRALDAYAAYREKNNAMSLTPFVDKEQFAAFMKDFYISYLQDATFEEYGEMLKKYFSEIFAPEDVFFDIGYSGRVELVLNKLLGFKIRSYYIHSNNEYLEKRCSLGDIENECFYDYKPIVTGVVREHIISELAPSTIGYALNDGKLEPVFDKFDMNYPTQFVTRLVQESAIDFVRDMRTYFGKGAVDIFARDYELSRPFEYYLHFSRSFDRNIFGDLEFEDDMGEGHTVSGIDFWNRSLERIHFGETAVYKEPAMPSAVKKRSRLMRALYLFLFDRKTFNQKLKNKLHKK